MIEERTYLNKVTEQELKDGVINIDSSYKKPNENECAMLFLVKPTKQDDNIVLLPINTYKMDVNKDFKYVAITPKEITKTTILRTLNTRDTFRDLEMSTYVKTNIEDNIYLAIVNLNLIELGIKSGNININLTPPTSSIN